MFTEFTNQSWTPSDVSVTVANNTDYSIDGSSKKIVWTDALSETVTVSFDAVNLGSYEEISLYIHHSGLFASGNIFSLTIDGNTYNFGRFTKKGWNHILIDCSSMVSVSSIVITGLVANLTLFIDYLGYRKVDYDSDTDVMLALKEHVSLSYGVSTTLSADCSTGDTSISLASTSYINDTTRLKLDDGGGTTEEVDLISRSGLIKTALSNSFTSGDTVTALCPTVIESHDTLELDPVCGIMVYNKETRKDTVVIEIKDGYKHKTQTGNIGVLIYIDARSKKKVLELARQFEVNCGERFKFLLDGELVEVYLSTSQFIDNELGNNPRMSYFYNIEPQPYTTTTTVSIDTLTITPDSVGANE